MRKMFREQCSFLYLLRGGFHFLCFSFFILCLQNIGTMWPENHTESCVMLTGDVIMLGSKLLGCMCSKQSLWGSTFSQPALGQTACQTVHVDDRHKRKWRSNVALKFYPVFNIDKDHGELADYQKIKTNNSCCSSSSLAIPPVFLLKCGVPNNYCLVFL